MNRHSSGGAAIPAERKTRGGRLRSVLIATSLIAISSLIGLVVADKLVALLLWRQVNLIFPANTIIAHKTSEFEYTVNINSMGFRDREVTPRVSGKRRIVVIGDSFVYGWGLKIEQAWPKVLEDELNAAGQNVEVFDLGSPGYGPAEYLEVARRAIPRLSPDLVIVGVLQGDDLMQERQRLDAKPERRSLRHRIADFVVPNIVTLLGGRRHLTQLAPQKESILRDTNKKQVSDLLKTLTPEQRSRLDLIDRQIYQMWLDGNLNPYILDSTAKSPDYFAFTLEPERDDVKQAVAGMGSCLREIRKEAEKVGAQEIVVSEPFDAYVTGGHWRDYGFRLPASAQTGSAQDDVIETACRQAEVKFYSFTDIFRREARKRRLHYEYDGHFTPEGASLFADSVARTCFGLKTAARWLPEPSHIAGETHRGLHDSDFVFTLSDVDTQRVVTGSLPASVILGLPGLRPVARFANGLRRFSHPHSLRKHSAKARLQLQMATVGTVVVS